MITTLTQAPAFSSSTLLPLKKPPTSPLYLKPFHNHTLNKKNRKLNNRRICRAEFSNDMPFVIAIGTCVLSSLVLATPDSKEEYDADSLTDTRFSVMGIISFIPFFNWLSWVFAWLDTGKRRYAVYSLVYLVPYLRSNLSLSPEEGWLTIASIIFCMVHIQIEASIRNGDLKGFQLFEKTSEYISSVTGIIGNGIKKFQSTYQSLVANMGSAGSVMQILTTQISRLKKKIRELFISSL